MPLLFKLLNQRKEKYRETVSFGFLFQRKHMVLVATETVIRSCSSFHLWVTPSADHVKTSREKCFLKSFYNWVLLAQKTCYVVLYTQWPELSFQEQRIIFTLSDGGKMLYYRLNDNCLEFTLECLKPFSVANWSPNYNIVTKTWTRVRQVMCPGHKI